MIESGIVSDKRVELANSELKSCIQHLGTALAYLGYPEEELTKVGGKFYDFVGSFATLGGGIK